MIQKETWHREALSMEGELAKLKKLLFQGAISEMDFAKAVMRMHGGSGLLEKDNKGNLRITSEWVTSHKEEVNKIESITYESSAILSTRGLTIKWWNANSSSGYSIGEDTFISIEREQQVVENRVVETNVLYAMEYERDGSVPVSPLQNDLYHRWEWRDSSEYGNAIKHLKAISSAFNLGAVAIILDSDMADFSALATRTLQTKVAESEEEFNESIAPLTKMLEDGLQVLRGAR